MNRLDADKMQRIHDIISNEPNPVDSLQIAADEHHGDTLWDRIYARAKLRDGTFHLSRSDTLVHSIVSNEATADRIVDILFSKITICGFVCSMICWWGLKVLTGEGVVMWYFVISMIFQPAFILYCLLLILCSNVSAFQLIVSGFDFWIKLGYTILYFVTSILYFVNVVSHPTTLIFTSLACVMLLCMVVLVSMVEGFHTSWKFSFALSLVISLITSIFAVRITLFWNGPEKELELWPGASIGLVSIFSSAMRVLTLFFWKQCIMTAYTRGTADKRGCICIYLAPQIQWTE